MAFVNERITPEDREKYFPKYEILERYYPRDWTIDKDRESILFLRSREREDMYSDELRDKYGEYRRQVDVFIYQNCIMEIEIIRPLDFVYHFNIDKFASVIPIFSANSFEVMHLSFKILSKFTTISPIML